MILLTCTCGAALRAPGNSSATEGVCPRCGHVIELPRLASAAIGAAISASEGGPIMLSLDARPASAGPKAAASLLHKLEGHQAAVRAAAFTCDGRFLATAGGTEAIDAGKSKQGEIFLWNVAEGTPVARQHGHKEAVLSIVFAAGGDTLYTGGLDGAIGVWETTAGIDQELVCLRQRTLRGHTGGVTSLSVSPDGAMLVSGSDDGTVRFWNVAGKCVEVLKTHRAGACSLTFSPDGAALAACWGSVGPVVLWDAAKRTVRQQIMERASEDADDLAVAFLQDGRRMAVLTKGEAQVWDLDSCQISLVCEAAGRHSMAACDKKGLLALGGHDIGTNYDVQLSNIDSGDRVARWKGHHMAVLGVAFSPDGATLASAGRDGIVHLWRVP